MSGRGSNSDEERAVVVEDKAENNNNNNNNNNNEAAEDAVLDQHQRDHSGLLTIGEKCVHLICEFIRGFSGDMRLLSRTVLKSAISLSRTCRTLYICVRNLPSVLELPQPPLSWLPLPRGTIVRDLGYWSDIAGIVWEVRQPEHLLELNNIVGAREADALLGKLLLSVDECRFPFLHGLEENTKERGALLHVLHRCGGLCINVDGWSDPIRRIGFEVAKCTRLRLFRVFATISDESASFHALATQLEKLDEGLPHHVLSASATIVGDETIEDSVDLHPFRRFLDIAARDISAIADLQPLRAAPFISLHFSDDANATLTDVRPLASAHTLHILHADVADVSVLGHVHTLHLSGCKSLTDVSPLAQVHSLRLTACDHVSDVRALRHVSRLDLIACHSVSDVSALGSVHSLYLSSCDSITDIAALASVHTLKILGCSGVVDVNVLCPGDKDEVDHVSHRLGCGIHSLSLPFSLKIVDVSRLGFVHTLNLSLCSNISDVSMLCDVHSLDLSHCTRVTDVRALGRVHTLCIYGCREVSDVSALGGVHTLNMGFCKRVSDVSALSSVHDLDLTSCQGITDVSALGSVHRLSLRACSRVTDVSCLGMVHTLEMADCSTMTDVSALGCNHALSLKACSNLTDVSSLGSVHTLT